MAGASERKWPTSVTEEIPREKTSRTSATTETISSHHSKPWVEDEMSASKMPNLTKTFDMHDLNEKSIKIDVKRPKPIVSYELYIKIGFWTRDVMNNTFAIFGCICNCLMIFVLATIGDNTERSVKIYFIFLAIYDNCFILARTCMNAFSHIWSNVDTELGSYWYATLYPYVNAFGVRLFTALSIWTTVVICLQRLLVILIPMHVRDSLLTKRPYHVVTAMTVILSGSLAINLFRWERVSEFNPSLNLTQYRESSAKFDAKRKEAMKIWNIIEHVVREGLPMVLIFLLVIAITIKTKMIQTERKRLTRQNTGPINNRELRLTRTSVAVAIFTFCCLFPLEILQLIFFMKPDLFLPVNRLLYVTLMFCLGPLHVLNSSVNFVIFILSSPTFRAHLAAKLFCRQPSVDIAYQSHRQGQ